MTARLISPKHISLVFSYAFTITLSLWGSPTLAGDPFRTTNPRNIGEKTEEAFSSIFQKGNYKKAKDYLIEAESEGKEEDEPLSHALRASLAYTEEDWDSLKNYASKTLKTAQDLVDKDPLRGNLYLAVGHFLDGTYIFEKEGAISALSKLQLVFKYLDEAEEKDSNDPELNLIKGYMDLLLAVNLPFSDPEQAIERLENYASPDYLVNRGIAVAYRDLDQYDKALKFVDQALKSTPENPELHYLKGQILRKQGRKEICKEGINDNNLSLIERALKYFNQAWTKSEQLPKFIVKPLKRERDKTEKLIEKQTCDL